MRTWADVKAFLFEHRMEQNYQFHVIQWNMSNRGCLVDNSTDEVLANTVEDAVQYLTAITR